MTETHTIDVTPYGFQGGDQDLHAEPVFCGVPMPGTDIAVVSPVTGEPVPLGEASESMAPYKVPLVEIVDEMPMTTTMKIRKVDLTARAQQLADGR
ncbi:MULTISPECIES: hypothetical protein [unclassified Streptomyces]|uniref:hypothetical protein n=1 Tax=unclassified Streptomyces TaxID=2593676 RepID=UPI002DDA344E|nr:hypothetical protein [Streptomyces sp. NBC_01445]WSE09267.1 hypothetical protein OG574_41445 [Streptomyces sp. NBC_01445]